MTILGFSLIKNIDLGESLTGEKWLTRTVSQSPYKESAVCSAQIPINYTAKVENLAVHTHSKINNHLIMLLQHDVFLR